MIFYSIFLCVCVCVYIIVVLIVLNFPTDNPLRIRLCANLTLSNVIAANSLRPVSPLNVIQFSFCHYNQLKFSNYETSFFFSFFSLDWDETHSMKEKKGIKMLKDSDAERTEWQKTLHSQNTVTFYVGCVILPLRIDWFKVLLWKYKSADYQSNMFRLNTFTLWREKKNKKKKRRKKKENFFTFT